MSERERTELRVGIDYLPATSHGPGKGRYVRELVRALVRLDERPFLGLWDVGRAERVIGEASLGLTAGDALVRRRVSHTSRRLLALAPLARWRCADRALGGLDLFHQVALDGPSIERALETFALSELPPRGSRAERRLGDRLARAAAVIVFSSEFALRVQQRFGLAAAQIERVPVGCEHWRRELARIERPRTPVRLIALGATRTERRPTVLLTAFEKLALQGAELELVFAGRAGSGEAALQAQLAHSPARGRVRRIVDPRESELATLVSSAHVLVHLSEDEGTPVTPLEACALGLDIVASRLPAFVEALGDLPLYVDNDEIVRAPERLAHTLARALERRDDAHLAARRELLAREFSWERNARATLELWQRLVRSSSR